jgi:hypothetical protein
MGSKQSKELFDYDEQIIYQFYDDIRVFSMIKQDSKTVIHVGLWPNLDGVYLKCIEDHRLIVFRQWENDRQLKVYPSIQFALTVYDKNFKVIKTQNASILRHNCVNPIFGPMSVSENKKCIYTYNFHPNFVRIDYQDKIEMKVENKLTSDLPYIDRHTPYENLHPSLLDRTAGRGIVITALPDHCIYIQRNREINAINGNRLSIHYDCWKTYQLKEDGVIHNVYYDKYDRLLIILYSKDNRYSLDLCRFEDDRWCNERIINLGIGINDDIIDIIALRRNYAINVKSTLHPYINVIVMDKYGIQTGYFWGNNINYDDKYDEWLANRLAFLKEIAVLGKMNVELLKIILLYV